MIVKDQPSALALFFSMQGSIVPQIAGKLVAVAGMTLAVLLVNAWVVPLPRISIAAMGIFGVALSLFLGFRNNAAYDRWWEARTLWGTMLADVRSLGREATMFLGETSDRRRVMSLLVASAHFHRGALRGVEVRDAVENWLSAEDFDRLSATRVPAEAALRDVAAHLAGLERAGAITGFAQMTLARSLASLGLMQAGCERIASTPLPFVYSLLVRRTTYLYCALLPFALIDTAGVFAPVFAVVVAYVFFGLQAVTNELEMPFRNSANGLALDAMCRSIEIAAAEAMGAEAPEPMRPTGYVLT